MLSVIDRYVLRSLLTNYLVALGSMLSLYVVLDMFVNMDEFTEHGFSVPVVLKNIAGYYIPNLCLYFAQLSGVITLFACTATIARMRKLNEMTAVLSSGVSLFRVARPVIIFGVAMSGLLVVDTEWVIPAVAHKLARDHDDAGGARAYEVTFLQDKDGALLSARRFHPITKDLTRLLVLWRDDEGNVSAMLEADHAVWESPGTLHPSGRWRLERALMTTRERVDNTMGPRERKRITYPTYYESVLSPEDIQVRQSEGWIRFLSLARLAELEKRGAENLAAVVQTKHARRAAPIISIVMLLLGLPFFLDRSPSNIVSDAGKSMIATGLCYVATFVAQSIQPTSTSALPAWLPILIFGTAAIVLIDRIRT